MQHIPVAKMIKFESVNDFKGKFIIEPLYPGYGLTVGNGLRRVLLSSMPGAAIVSVKIAGVDHEFSTLDYVKEDVVDITLNIKQVNLSIQGELDPTEPLVIKISKTGEGKVTAKDFKVPTQVKIANPEQHIATLTDKAAKFEMECVVEKGIGYLPTENRPGEKLEIGHIAVDAIFTPINHVSMETEHVRVGEMTNWDRLILSLETNGAVTCEQAFNLTIDILVEQFSALAKKEEVKEEVKEKEVALSQEAQKNTEPVSKSKASEEKPRKRGRPSLRQDGPKKEDK
ncbi:DNA-directed RNA polymerase subunit alpha [Candidatus Kuenenbacteria bacterium CG_4_9_14_3_um_filter_39_14]|uniref:DNA-directed RNA polymerase subunit alpha n=7 Tax=Candidatus Kueneniibacteriota TaxID=1752740 RepID=A0A2M7IMI1_9BACT|nr:MAG: DNA-directed RNA polymerase subunit alpha [Candidatus Kuenenbacteria bacterium CG22_combo_CG10-13_8_21_14_all_39_9]PIR80546.1 MAG: DNA-directed RNA polymerase subunit alpha [Candidatus Kuenenbacteria bacterium CG10_big_fil_rev_8_21_14_0_10_39_14]PIW96042.1 MAG: DNA-directed RNA polymerase subunit alpha [Candidatus Kuenenbacteria bacterium CG_4_8_14_3_um_filter_39_15]PIX92505.1 MAG: DNA-directed RNA polymerase subunit alpha [Candidatus Kuenenbacteria bacterium CG_4_10_14_3_um_filter_39_14